MNMMKIKNNHLLIIEMFQTICMIGQCHKKLSVNNFEWVKDTSQFNEDFIKKYNEESDKGYFLEDDVQYPKKLSEIHSDLPFLLERKKN